MHIEISYVKYAGKDVQICNVKVHIYLMGNVKVIQ